ncbi:hypothetical protein ACFL6Y_03975 [Elusimicrobiota bacterium]
MPYTRTKEEILAAIKQKPGITAKEILARFNLTRAIIFRHLKGLQAHGKIIKLGKTPKVSYFVREHLASTAEIDHKFFNWALTGDNKFLKAGWLCSTRDTLQGRIEKLLKLLKNLIDENALYSLVGAVAEIGNNSFDHNFGNWRDTPGALFAVDAKNRKILLADRGQGVFATIRKVRPKISNDKEALRIAFTEIVSGRYPEQRGNGLKYVKKVVKENKLYLEFYSGCAAGKFSSMNMTIDENPEKPVPGTLAIIKF